jgi:acetyl esterase/lipase
VIVIPGGGYAVRADHEKRPIAEWLNQIGLHSFVLTYRVAPYKHPCPLLDLQRAIRLVRHYALHWKIDPRKIGVLGFSAGGHLAATSGTHNDHGRPQADDPVERAGCRPDFMVLCYPVISFEKFGHLGTRKNLIGENPDPALVHNLSNEQQVGPDTPPAFLWHTADDAVVPVEHSLLFTEALSRHNINHELHVFSRGVHGVGLAIDNPHLAAWTGLCENWMKVSGFLVH